MSISEDVLENERLARQVAIRAELDKTDTKAEVKAETPEPRTFYGRKLYPWEVIVKGRPVQFRPMTSREVEAMDEKTLMENIKRQDEAHAKKVQAAIRERDAEQKDMDKRAAHEKKTGKREYGKERFISLEEARARGLLQSENASNGRPEWWSEGNPDGIMGGGR